MQIITHNTGETEAFGERLAEKLHPGDVIAYRGELGVGKTALTRGIAAPGIFSELLYVVNISILYARQQHQLRASLVVVVDSERMERRLGFHPRLIFHSMFFV